MSRSVDLLPTIHAAVPVRDFRKQAVSPKALPALLATRTWHPEDGESWSPLDPSVVRLSLGPIGEQ